MLPVRLRSPVKIAFGSPRRREEIRTLVIAALQEALTDARAPAQSLRSTA